VTGLSSAELERIVGSVRPVLDDRFAARERGITGSRQVIRASANAIRSLHRDEVDEAAALLVQAGDLLSGITAGLSDHQDILHAGFVTDAAKEYAEARITAAIFSSLPLPTPAEVGVDAVPYLHGLGEAVGECRRRMLDRLRADDVAEAERLLAAMDAIVDLLATMDYPDGMTSGLRRTTDVGRSLVERSRADLTSTVVQNRLRRDLEQRPPG
jgi:translin